jgi:DNA-binding transcriptional regulator GbsR (MarR family)
MNAFDLRSIEQDPGSGVFNRPLAQSSDVRRQFVNNWGRMAATFGMPKDLGRVHAQLFIAEGGVDAATIAQSLELDVDSVRSHLGALMDWGVVKMSRGAHAEMYVTARDPWDFFLEIMRQRHKREFMPILQLVRETAALARQLRGHNSEDAGTRARVELFSKFVEDLSSLIEVFVRVGSKPMALALKTFARMAPRA